MTRSGWTIAEAIGRIGSEGLSRSLSDGKIIAYEGAETRADKPTPIEYWKRQKGTEWAQFLVSPETETIRNGLRFFPLLHSPDAAARLDRVQLRDAVLRFILNDPEVEASATKMLVQESRHADVFLTGRYPGLVIDYRWPLSLNADDLAWHFAKPVFIALGAPDTVISPVVKKTAELIVDLWQALIELLRSGRLDAIGTWMESGEVVSISRTQWSRGSLLLDLQCGDLVDEGDERRPARSWTGLELKAAPDQFHVEPLVRDRVPPSTTVPAQAKRKSAAQTSIERAISALWPSGLPAGLLIKQRDTQIIRWIKDHGLTVPSSKTISRYFAHHDGACP